jgi:hypothetical protein
VFISATSVMDTVDLPAGASLKNGIETPPPVPPINPRRRFGFGRSNESNDGAVQPPRPPFAEVQRTNSADELNANRVKGNRLRKSSSEGRSLNVRNSPPVLSPAHPPHGFNGVNDSPPRPMAEGAMF